MHEVKHKKTKPSTPVKKTPSPKKESFPQEAPLDAFPYNDLYQLNDVQEFLTWHAPGRPFRQRTREYFINGFLITMAVEIILFLFSQYLLMVVVLALVFLAFALASVPPRSFFYKITSEGIRVEDNFFIWEELYDFYFMKDHGEKTLYVRTKAFFPGELIITLGPLSPDVVKATLLPFLPFREHVEPGFLQKAGDWLERNFPLERSLQQ